MHNVAIFRITAQDIGDNLAESLRIKTLVNVLYSIVYVFLGGADSAHHVSIGFVHCYII